MIWKSMPLAFRFSIAYALVFFFAMMAGAQSHASQASWSQPYRPPAPQFASAPQPAVNPYPASGPSHASTARAHQQAEQPQQAPQPSAAYPRQAPLAGLANTLTPRLAARASELRDAPIGYNSYDNAWAASNCDTCTEGSICGPGMCCKPVVWGGRVGALFLDRDDENHRFYSFDGADESIQVLDSQDANFDVGYGVEAWLSRFDYCRQCGFEIGYWGIYPNEQIATVGAADVVGTLDGIFNFDQLDYNGATADNFVNGALVHRLRRQSEIHNAEFNWLWGLPLQGGQASPWTFRALAGFRFFRLEDNLEFGSDTVDTFFTGAADELYYTIDTENNLYGLQFGGIGERRLGGSRWSASWGAKAGVFGNQAEAHSVIGGAAGIATVNNGPNSGRDWDIRSSKDDLAFLGEVQAGLGYQIGWHWRLIGQYRVVGISGIALPTNQIYQDLRGLQDVELAATNGSLILHGAFLGAERAY